MMQKLVIFAINVLLVAGQCPANFEQHGNSCYFFSHDAETWISALELCKSMSMADLISVDNEAESQYMLHRIAQLGSKGAWLGANDIITEGTWVWGNSENNVTFDKWFPGEPNNVNGNENCAIATSSLFASGWYDIECKSYVPYICETPTKR